MGPGRGGHNLDTAITENLLNEAKRKWEKREKIARGDWRIPISSAARGKGNVTSVIAECLLWVRTEAAQGVTVDNHDVILILRNLFSTVSLTFWWG